MKLPTEDRAACVQLLKENKIAWRRDMTGAPVVKTAAGETSWEYAVSKGLVRLR